MKKLAKRVMGLALAAVMFMSIALSAVPALEANAAPAYGKMSHLMSTSENANGHFGGATPEAFVLSTNSTFTNETFSFVLKLASTPDDTRLRFVNKYVSDTDWAYIGYGGGDSWFIEYCVNGNSAYETFEGLSHLNQNDMIAVNGTYTGSGLTLNVENLTQGRTETATITNASFLSLNNTAGKVGFGAATFSTSYTEIYFADVNVGNTKLGFTDFAKYNTTGFVWEEVTNSVSVNKTELFVGETASITGENLDTITWSVSDDSVIAIDTETFVISALSAGNATVTATFVDGVTQVLEFTINEVPEPEVPVNPFEDVYDTDYYYEPVMWAVEEGITDGWTETLFAPSMACTRGQVVTFLWRAAGEPQATTNENPFNDVAEGAYYYEAVLWAVEEGITDGWTPTEFAPEMECTRGQIVTFIWRAAGEPVVEADENPFVDVAANAYYYDAVLWAVEEGITDGWTPTEFAPEMECTRGQIVTFLHRYYN